MKTMLIRQTVTMTVMQLILMAQTKEDDQMGGNYTLPVVEVNDDDSAERFGQYACFNETKQVNLCYSYHVL